MRSRSHPCTVIWICAEIIKLNRLSKPLVFFVCLLPFGLLVFNGINGRLGANPIEEITHFTGIWALNFLLITLSITPLRKLTRINALIRFRRMLGLYTFFYALLHCLTYFVLDQYFDWPEIVRDIVKRPYITVGFTAFILLLPLALTSNRTMINRLGAKWKQLHSIIYLIGILAILHFLWLVKADLLEPLIYGTVLVLLLIFRLPLFKFRLPGAGQPSAR